MAKSDRQRFNFLTAMNRQLEQAASEGDGEYEQFRTLVQAIHRGDGELDDTAGVVDRLDAHAQWLAALEARVEDLEQDLSAELSEEADGPDDGLDDEDMGGDESRLGGDERDAGRHPANLVRTSERPVAGRSVRKIGHVTPPR